ncbi:POU domain protein [Fasciola hepatica]|uniref:POU domain protein n=1 Tax=Fasciola hepatica TaxID=6192 RepID=A0A4E0RPF6_FASHE|nr:POU domain protein [Fasciola hepatica]
MLHSVAKILEDSESKFGVPNSIQETYTEKQSPESGICYNPWKEKSHFCDQIVDNHGLDRLICVLKGHFGSPHPCFGASMLDKRQFPSLLSSNDKIIGEELKKWDPELFQLRLYSVHCTGNGSYPMACTDNSSHPVEIKSSTCRTRSNSNSSSVSEVPKEKKSVAFLNSNRTQNVQRHNSLPVEFLIQNELSAQCHSVTESVQRVQTETNSVAAKPFRLKDLLHSGHPVLEDKELQDICEFARYFKFRRLTMGLTQTQVCFSLNAKEGSAYSQSAICRFEKLDVTVKSAKRMKPVLEKWLADKDLEASLYKESNGNLHYLKFQSSSVRRRKRRTCFSPQALSYLTDQLRRNPYPSRTEMTRLSEILTYDREVIRVWFCNRRQALKSEVNGSIEKSS